MKKWPYSKPEKNEAKVRQKTVQFSWCVRVSVLRQTRSASKFRQKDLGTEKWNQETKRLQRKASQEILSFFCPQISKVCQIG